MEHFGELGMMAHPVAVAADVDNVAVMEQPVVRMGRKTYYDGWGD